MTRSNWRCSVSANVPENPIPALLTTMFRYAVMCRDGLREPNHGLFVGHVHLIGVGTATEHCFGAAGLRRDVLQVPQCPARFRD